MSNVHSSVMFSSSAIAEEGAPFLIIDELQRGGDFCSGRTLLSFISVEFVIEFILSSWVVAFASACSFISSRAEPMLISMAGVFVLVVGCRWC